MSIISLEKLLQSGQNSALDKLVQSAQFTEELTLNLRKELDPEIAENLISANIRDNGELILVASSSAWAAKLRFEADGLLRCARQHAANISRCKVAVVK